MKSNQFAIENCVPVCVRQSTSDSRVYVGTHDGNFHADEVFAICAILEKMDIESENASVYVFRTRDPSVLSKMDWVIDVGSEYNKDTKRFDHHQKSFDHTRKNGVPYASFGLVWDELQTNVSGFVWSAVDECVVQPIDGADCGHPTFEGNTYSISAIISDMNPNWNEDVDVDLLFVDAVAFAKGILERKIRRYVALEESFTYAKEALANRERPELVVLEQFSPWQHIVCEDEDVQFIVYPHLDGGWRVQSVPTEPGGFESRSLLPEKWRGLDLEELQEECGIKGAVFCHRNGFVGGAKTKEETIKMANIALLK